MLMLLCSLCVTTPMSCPTHSYVSISHPHYPRQYLLCRLPSFLIPFFHLISSCIILGSMYPGGSYSLTNPNFFLSISFSLACLSTHRHCSSFPHHIIFAIFEFSLASVPSTHLIVHLDNSLLVCLGHTNNTLHRIRCNCQLLICAPRKH
ncbi:hypothetical protein BXZ70DRAFT_531312 [Cristinia sonorae]|uniref:Uncharacterized protein n=1 Tax=Cristinia sonorae TaxID=1940300 RepID=A0A8K0XU30_9AGAR|nr:hypothetical protein BXZ70DRAFT_531312 [Cristinia sonorae]